MKTSQTITELKYTIIAWAKCQRVDDREMWSTDICVFVIAFPVGDFPNHSNITFTNENCGRTSQFSHAPPFKELNRPVHDKLDKTLSKLGLCISSSLPSLTGVRYSSRHCLHTLDLSQLIFEAIQPECTNVTIQARPQATQTNSNDRFSISCLTAVK